MIWVVSKLQLWVGKKSWGWNYLGFLNISLKNLEDSVAQVLLVSSVELSFIRSGCSWRPPYLYCPFSPAGRRCTAWMSLLGELSPELLCNPAWRSRGLRAVGWRDKGLFSDQHSVHMKSVEPELCFKIWVHLISSQTEKFYRESTQHYL